MNTQFLTQKRAPALNFLCTLELVSSIIESLNGESERLISKSQFVPLINEIAKYPIPNVAYIAYIVVGDIAINCPNYLIDYIPNLISVMISNGLSNPRYYDVCNNAAWAIGEIILRLNNILDPYIDQIALKLRDILRTIHNPELMQTSSYTFCKLAVVSPQKVSHLLNEVVDPICKNLRDHNMANRHDKEIIFKGLVSMCNTNPEGVLKHFNQFCDTVVSYYDPTEEMINIFGNLFHSYKNMLAITNRWPSIFNCLNERTKEKLRKIYKL